MSICHWYAHAHTYMGAHTPQTQILHMYIYTDIQMNGDVDGMVRAPLCCYHFSLHGCGATLSSRPCYQSRILSLPSGPSPTGVQRQFSTCDFVTLISTLQA